MVGGVGGGDGGASGLQPQKNMQNDLKETRKIHKDTQTQALGPQHDANETIQRHNTTTETQTDHRYTQH